jgi:hypothetical protein
VCRHLPVLHNRPSQYELVGDRHELHSLAAGRNLDRHGIGRRAKAILPSGRSLSFSEFGLLLPSSMGTGIFPCLAGEGHLGEFSLSRVAVFFSGTQFHAWQPLPESLI